MSSDIKYLVGGLSGGIASHLAFNKSNAPVVVIPSQDNGDIIREIIELNKRPEILVTNQHIGVVKSEPIPYTLPEYPIDFCRTKPKEKKRFTTDSGSYKKRK